MAVLLSSVSLLRYRLVVVVVVARPGALQSHEQRKSAEENKRTTVTPVKSGGYAGCLPALRVHEHDDNPPNTLQRANHTASPFSNYSNGPVGLGLSALQRAVVCLWGSACRRPGSGL